MKRKTNIFMLFALLMTTLFIANNALAIPAFARRYKISCTTCHAPFPKLKDYGDEFAGNGMVLIEEEKERDYVTAGDDLLWLNKDFPIAARFEAFALLDQENDVEKDLQIPWGLKLLSGGTLFKNIGYYFYFYMSERGEVAGIEDAYIHFNNIFGSNLDVMLGQFQTSDPLMKRELRLTYHDYMIYKQRIGLSNTHLTYDRGVMLLYGIEKSGTDIVGLLVNGNGKPEAFNDTFDQDNYKNYGFRLSQSIGDFLSLGGYYYKGKEGSPIDTLAGINEISYWGPDFTVSIGPFELTTQYLERQDSDPYFTDGAEVKTRGTIVEVTFSPHLDKSRYYLTGLYNKIDADMSIYNYEAATLSGTYLLARNCRLVAEYTRDLFNDENQFLIGVVSGF